MNYGLPYKGSKNKLATRIVDLFPKARYFVDLFAGGCAVTHAAMLSGKFEKFIINDINPLCTELFNDAILGKYRDERRWISREEFFESSEPYVKFCWSFGNNLRDYLYSTKIEPYKKACHYAIVFDEWKDMQALCPEVTEAAKRALDGVSDIRERRLRFGPSVVKWLKDNGTLEMVEGNPLYNSCHRNNHSSLESLERLERLQSLERLESLQSLERLNKNYWEVPIPEDSVVYCDIPYRNTDGYGAIKGKSCFDHDKFYSWALSRPFPVYVSEYAMPQGFHTFASFKHVSSLSAIKTNAVTEKIFCNKPIYRYGENLDLFGGENG